MHSSVLGTLQSRLNACFLPLVKHGVIDHVHA